MKVKFLQIAPVLSSSGMILLYGLDLQGRVWLKIRGGEKWELIDSPEVEDEKNEVE